MISLNLLPDIKKEYLQTQRLKRLLMVGSIITSLLFVTVAILLAIFVFGYQRLERSNTQSEIDEALAQLQSKPDLDKIVTIQKQIEALPSLHDQKPAAQRLFDYLNTLIPKDISLIKVDFFFGGTSENALFGAEGEAGAEINGSGPDANAVNVFVDTLKNAEFTFDGAPEVIKPLTSVILEFSVEEDRNTFKIVLKFDPVLFDNTKTGAKLSVPKITTSNSVKERPTGLFAAPSEEGQN
ncbi:MAG TPA: hypothetical protein VGA08_00710 [Candidatus Saccharimonadales bacterium]